MQFYFHIIIASNPICNLSNVTVMANDYIRLQCNVTYGGVWRPVMEWTLLGFLEREKIFNDSTLTATIENDVTESQQYTTMTASVQILTKPHHNGISFVCSTHFHRSDMSVKYKVNNNTPDYNHTWISPKINVLCKFNISIKYRVGPFLKALPSGPPGGFRISNSNGPPVA